MRLTAKKGKKKDIIIVIIILGIILTGIVAYKSYLHITFSKRAAIELNLKDKSLNGISVSSSGLFTSANYSPVSGTNTVDMNLHMAKGVEV